jgi:hypothetical protein
MATEVYVEYAQVNNILTIKPSAGRVQVVFLCLNQKIFKEARKIFNSKECIISL